MCDQSGGSISSPQSSFFPSYSSPSPFSFSSFSPYGSFNPYGYGGLMAPQAMDMNGSMLPKSLFFPNGSQTPTTPTQPPAPTTPTTPPAPSQPPPGRLTPAPQYGAGMYVDQNGNPVNSQGQMVSLDQLNGPGNNSLVQSNGQFGFGPGNPVPLSPVTAGYLGLTKNANGQYVNGQGQIAGLIQ